MTERFRCEDCGLEFDEGEFGRDDLPMACPYCEGLDVQLIGDSPHEAEGSVAAEDPKAA
jgi:hypothetical protein